jgi:methylmalonyl-CoA/ethylmalonyl-CoA epimerase
MPLDTTAAYQQLAHASATRSPGGLLGGLLVGIDHVGLCVADITAAGGGWAALLGVPVTDREDVGPQKTTAAFLRMPGGAAAVELVCPMPGNAGLEKFVAQRGDAMHHIAFAVSDLSTALARLVDGGIELIDRTPRPGAGGHLVAFLHPRALGGTLVELVERKGAPR